MFRQNRKIWRRIVIVPTGLAIACVLSLSGLRGIAQDNIANTSGQGTGVLPPPVPQQSGGPAASSFSQQPATDEVRALDASQNAAHSMQKPDQDQSLVPPPAPMPSQAYAQLGVFTDASDGPGVRVRSVTPGSAAEVAGIRPGDFLLSVGGQNVEMPDELTRLIRQRKPGDNVEVRIWRDRSDFVVNVFLKEAQPSDVRQVYRTNAPATYQGAVVENYGPGRVYSRQYSYYPGSYPGGAYYGYRNYGYPYRGQYYGTPRFGYYNSPWGGEGVNIGGFQFGWR